MTLTGLQPVETISSYAHLSDGEVRVVLHLPESGELTGHAVRMRLRSAKRSIWTTASVSPAAPGVLLEARLPRKGLANKVWSLAIRPEDGTAVRVQARLLASRKQPVALLVGPTPATRMKAPAPHPAPTSGSRRAAVKVVDRALSVLPPERATQVRGRLRSVAGRVWR